MNKDLDDRLIPNGEYRDAQNISVGKSEDDDIGALENVKGNIIQSIPGFTYPANLEVIGQFTDNNNSIIYFFLTNNTPSAAGTSHYVFSFNIKEDGSTAWLLLLTGSFLNFSTTNPIYGVNLVENLLFWTDNRNQPRKINVDKASKSASPTASNQYYTEEHQISVAKYNPWEPLTLLKSVVVTQATGTAATTITLATANAAIKKGMDVVVKDQAGVTKVDANKYIYVTNIVGTAVTLNAQPTDQSNANYTILSSDTVTFLATTMTGKNISLDFNDGDNWPGDPDFLEDKFVRFSYRFQFDDKEYSLMAPFSQPTFIPQQKGYFLNGDEDATFRSTILRFMQNGVQNVELIIPLPDIKNNLGELNNDTYKITAIDILYKESDARAVKVIDTIKTDFTGTDNFHVYKYQSRKPYKVLPERQTVRVYDRVPVRALSQEVSGNRVIYGNFQSQHTPPAALQYNVGANAKSTTAFTTWAEYPNHTLKQNRNYQVGFILADKFGRQSSVILSNVDDGTVDGGAFFGGSTIYHPYKNSLENVKEWFGDALKVVVSGNGITSSVGQDGEGAPGLYADAIGNGFNTTANTIGSTSPFLYTFTLGSNQTDIPVQNSYLRGEFVDFVKVTNVNATNAPIYVITTDGQVNSLTYSTNLNNPDIKFSYNLNNALGWYSYKVVVKQQEQDYYNAYLPGFLNGYPSVTGVTPSPPPVFPTTENNKTAHVVLLNDNINKIPRDLTEVGPEQKQFRSSVRLYGRVNNTAASNAQFFPVSISATQNQVLPLAMTADTIATASDLDMSSSDISTTNVPFYQLESNPLIARLATRDAGTTVGTSSGIIGITAASTAGIFLTVAETEPVETALELFYETSTAGLIADLNADVNTGFDGVAGLSALSYSQGEEDPNDHPVTAVFYPQNNQGVNILNTSIAAGYPIINVIDANSPSQTRATGNISNPSGDFKIVQSAQGYQIKTNNNSFVFGINGGTVEKYTFTLTWKTTAANASESQTVSNVALDNKIPNFTVGSSLPDVQVAAGETAVVTRGAVNGSATNSVTGLYYNILATGNESGYFSINQTGQITKSLSTPVGVYNITVRIQDASNGSVAQTGSLFLELPQKITVGNTLLNSSAISTCYSFRTPGLVGSNSMTAPYDASVSPTGVWYLSNSTLSASDLPVTPTANVSNFSTYLWKLGSAVSQGSVVFTCHMQQKFTGSGLGFNSSAVSKWIVYYRDPNGANSWSQVADLNNDNMGAPGIPAAISVQPGNTEYAQAAISFNLVGEYCIAAVQFETTTASQASDALVLWVNSADLNNNACVVEDGVYITDGSAGKPIRSYSYDIGSGSASYSCSNTGNTAVYSPSPYGNYVSLFYTDAAMTTPKTFPASNPYYSFKTDSTEPFTEIRYSAKFNTSGIKITPALDPDPCFDMYARACSAGTTITCAHPVMGDMGWT